MQLAGLKKSSLIDYPQKVSCVIFFTGCNFTCPYCHNPELARSEYPERIPVSQVLSFLEARQKLLDGVVFTGGEPTLDSHLPELCMEIRALGYAVKLDTNGSRPDILASLIEDGAIDYIAMDIKTAIEAYGPPLCDIQTRDRIAQSIQLIMESGLDYEFRTTCVQPFIDEAIIQRIAKRLEGANQYWLQSFNKKRLLQADFLQKYPNPDFTPDQMRRFQALAAPYVKNCGVR